MHVWQPGGTTIPCQDGSAWWVQSLQCYAQVMPEQPPKESPVWGGHTDGALYSCTFYTGGRAFPGTNGFSFWSATAPAGPPLSTQWCSPSRRCGR